MGYKYLMCMQKQLNSTNFITKDSKIINEWKFLYKTNALKHDLKNNNNVYIIKLSLNGILGKSRYLSS